MTKDAVLMHILLHKVRPDQNPASIFYTKLIQNNRRDQVDLMIKVSVIE